jgi:parallel beta-helix repeat protein
MRCNYIREVRKMNKKYGLLNKIFIICITVLIISVCAVSSFGYNIEKKSFIVLNSRGYIQDLIDNASEGDTIFVPSGIYYEQIIINKSISLIGENKETTIIDGGEADKSDSRDIIDISADWVNISGFTIRNSKQGIHYEAAINLVSNYSTISGNIFTKNFWCADVSFSRYNTFSDNIINLTDGGIHLVFSDYNTISNNFISSYRQGVYIYRSVKNNVIDNEFHKGGLFFIESFGTTVYNNTINGKTLAYFESKHGITIDEDAGQIILLSCSGITVKNQVLSRTYTGLQVSKSSNCLFSGNIISDNFHGLSISDSNNNTITDNNIYNNTYTGLGIYRDGKDSNISNNKISKNNRGLYIFNCRQGVDVYNNSITHNNISMDISTISKDCIVSCNLISNNDYGINISVDSIRNTLYHNNFINNTLNACDEGANYWNDSYPAGGNYWDDYTGEDNNGDGIGDTPYPIPGGYNQDNYPLIEPWNNKPPSVEIINPKVGFFHISGIPLLPTPLNLISDTISIGGFRLRPIIINAVDDIFDSEDLFVKVYLNGEEQGNASYCCDWRLHEWFWTGFALGNYNLTITAEDPFGEIGIAEIKIWNFCFLP